MKAILLKNQQSIYTVITSQNKEAFVSYRTMMEDLLNEQGFQVTFADNTAVSFLQIDEKILKNIGFDKIDIDANNSPILIENYDIQPNLSNITKLFTQNSEVTGKINLQLVFKTSVLSYDILPSELTKLYNLISDTIIFLRKLPCEHNLIKNNIELFAEIDYLLLDQIMVLLYNFK